MEADVDSCLLIYVEAVVPLTHDQLNRTIIQVLDSQELALQSGFMHVDCLANVQACEELKSVFKAHPESV